MKGKLLRVAVIVMFLHASGPASWAGGVEARAAFQQLKTLVGTWHGQAEGEGQAAEADAVTEVVHEIQVSAAGTVVMETMGPGSEHEMINMYHLDGDDLLLTHYCAGGNQPRMKLNRDASTPESLVFDFVGGTNLDPAVDEHIHAAKIRIVDQDALESVWFGWTGGEQAGVMRFHLARTN